MSIILSFFSCSSPSKSHDRSNLDAGEFSLSFAMITDDVCDGVAPPSTDPKVLSASCETGSARGKEGRSSYRRKSASEETLWTPSNQEPPEHACCLTPGRNRSALRQSPLWAPNLVSNYSMRRSSEAGLFLCPLRHCKCNCRYDGQWLFLS